MLIYFTDINSKMADVDWAGAADAQEKTLVKKVNDLEVNG